MFSLRYLSNSHRKKEVNSSTAKVFISYKTEETTGASGLKYSNQMAGVLTGDDDLGEEASKNEIK